MLIRYIKSLRALKGLSQIEMAKAMSLSVVSYNKKENGKVPFTIDEVKFMSTFFNVPIENFFNEEVHEMNTNKAN